MKKRFTNEQIVAALQRPGMARKNSRWQIVFGDPRMQYKICLFNLLRRFRVTEVIVLHRLNPPELRRSDFALDHRTVPLRFLLGNPLAQVFRD